MLPAAAKPKLHYVVLLACNIADEQPGIIEIHGLGTPEEKEVSRNVYDSQGKKIRDLESVAGKKIIKSTGNLVDAERLRHACLSSYALWIALRRAVTRTSLSAGAMSRVRA